MKVYAAAERQRTGVSQLHIAPAAHLTRGDLPADWTDEFGNPVNFTVTFRDGVAIVDPAIGRYLLEHGMARRTGLIMPRLVA